MRRTTEPLSEHTWLKIGGMAEIAIPETKEELIELLKDCEKNNRSYRILGNGSNLLVSDEGIDELVIKYNEACTQIQIEDGIVKAGASVSVPQFVNKIVEHDLGGYEYLYSVPGTVGGAIYMNAGRGESHQKTIADYLEEVEIYDGTEVRKIPVGEIEFSHRYSTFKDRPEWIILSGVFKPPTQPKKAGREKIRDRMEKVNQRERSKPNAGTVFSSGVKIPLSRIPPNGLSIGDARFVHSNRICNDGEATYSDVKNLILVAKWLHRVIPGLEEPELEYEIWK